MLFEQQLIEDESELRYQALVRISGVVTVIHCSATLPKRFTPCGKVRKSFFAPSTVTRKAKRRSLNLRRLPMKRWPRAMKRSSPKLRRLSRSGMSRLVKLMQLTKTQASTDASSTVGTRGSGSKRSAFRPRRRRGVYQLPTHWKNFRSSFLTERTKADGIVPEHSSFVAIDALLADAINAQ